MNDTKHSPWSADKQTGTVITNALGGLVVNGSAPGAALCAEDAALIVEAVNSHARLLAERDEAVAALKGMTDDAANTYYAIKQHGGPEVSIGQFGRLRTARALLSRLEDRK